jgi:hypothetical protein
VPTPEAASSTPRDPLRGAIALAPHPAFGAGPLRSLQASVALDGNGSVTAEFAAHGELSRLRLAPVTTAPQRRTGLWHHSCFELFARRGAERGYLEFNFAPSGDWAAWVFEDYRSGGRELERARVGITTFSADDGRWSLRAQLELGDTGATAGVEAAAQTWWLNLAAVIEAEDGSLSYWAAHHAGAQPDFHDRSCFCLPLRPSQAAATPRARSR